MWDGFGLAPAETMRLFLDDLAGRHGSVEGYVTDVLGLDAAVIGGLREHLLTGPIPAE
jgi:protein-tyrosine phosphatase